MTGAMMRKTRQQDRREETRKQVLGSGTEALCLVGKVVYCSVVLRCINYRMRNDKLCRRAMYSHTERQTDRQTDSCESIRMQTQSFHHKSFYLGDFMSLF